VTKKVDTSKLVVPVTELEPFDKFVQEPLPEAEWLIEPLFEKNSQTILFGPSGEGKSFVALSWAISIAAGVPWLGKYPVMQGSVIYSIGEGSRGMRRRAYACAKHMGLTPDQLKNLHFLPNAPQLRDKEGLERFLKQCKAIGPVLVIIDTLARSAVGMDENTAKDMGEWIHAAGVIMSETGACVMPIHHTPKNKKPGSPPSERGNSALRGAMDTSIGVSMADGFIRLTNFKQKDDAQFEPIVVGTEIYEIRPATAEKKAMTSLVLVPADDVIPVSMADGPQLAVELLRNEGKPLTKTEWWELLTTHCKTHKVKLPSRATFFRWPEKLAANGQVHEEDGKFSVLRLVKGDAA
jgi:hypothetical protein